MKKNKVNKFCLEGLNINRLLMQLQVLEIPTYNFNKIDYNKVEFEIDVENFDKVDKLVTKLNFNIEKKHSGFLHSANFIKDRIGIIVGLIIALATSIYINMYTLDFKILGLEYLDENQIVEVVNNFGVKKFKINNFEAENLEQYIITQIPEISMVSIVKKGTTIIINAKEKLKEYGDGFNPIVAEQNMLIDEIIVYSGTANKKVGDAVFENENIVLPYIIDDFGNKTMVEPKAYVVGKVWYSSVESFEVMQKLSVKTGNYIILNESFEIGKFKIYNKENENCFEQYEIEEKNIEISNKLLPINYKSTIAYEVKEEYNERDFNEYKDELINKNFQLAYKKVPLNALIEEEKVVISNNEKYYYICVYLQSTIQIGEKNEN